MVQVLRDEVPEVVRETIEEQERKTDNRFEKVFKRMAMIAKTSDQGFEEIKKTREADQAALKEWQVGVDARIKEALVLAKTVQSENKPAENQEHSPRASSAPVGCS